MRSNARVVVRAPMLLGLSDAATSDVFVPNLKQGRRSDTFCTQAEEESETEVVLDVERAEWKSNLLHPRTPRRQAARPRRRCDAVDLHPAPVQVTGNYVNMDAPEAAGQR